MAPRPRPLFRALGIDRAPLGDIDDALAQLERNEELLTCCRHPDLVRQVHDTVMSWADHPADRLVQLMPLLDDLAEIAGSSLPLQLPPTT